jgi:hypothetical protein
VKNAVGWAISLGLLPPGSIEPMPRSAP